MDPPSIQLIDNTVPVERHPDDCATASRTTTRATDLSSTVSRLWSRPSIRGELTRRKYAKWQPDRLGVSDDSSFDRPSSSDGARLSALDTNNSMRTNPSIPGQGDDNASPRASSSTQSEFEQDLERRATKATRIATTTTTGTNHFAENHPKICGLKPGSELDILYENQRGWFFFGIPLYSHSSLLNLDPAAWMTPNRRPSLVNITNAQVPDPSWEWAWRAWYVDMSGDVDEQGWQYAFSFGSSAWHGTHPFGRSFVRRRRWVRLRVKRTAETAHRHRSQTGLEMGHRLNPDYFTIHSAKPSKRATSISDTLSRVTSGYLSRATSQLNEDLAPEEIKNIPSLMLALRVAIVDRQKLDAVKKFIEEGEEELYYLDTKIPDIMSRFVYQASRWQFLTYIKNTIRELSQATSETSGREAENTRRKQDNLVKATQVARHYLASPEVFHAQSEAQAPEPASEMLDLMLETKRDGPFSRYSGKFTFTPLGNGGAIKGIPKEAEIGREGHIY